MAGLSGPPIKNLSLLFVKVSDVAPPSNKGEYVDINGLDIIYALERVSGRGSIECAQRMRNIFRIYCKTKTASNKLSTEGFTFNNHQVPLYTRNPFSVSDQSSETVKIIIGGVPLSVANDEFLKALFDLKVEIVSDLKFENYRDREGKWTDYKTGRRFIYCKKPTLNLMPFTKIGLWNASIYYRGQIRPNKNPGLSTDHTGKTQIEEHDDNHINDPLNTEISIAFRDTLVNAMTSDSCSSNEAAKSIPTNTDSGKPGPSSDVATNSASSKSGVPSPSGEEIKSSKGSGKSGKSPKTRGRTQHKQKNNADPNQRNISSLFRRRVSPSTSRSRSKRGFNNDGTSHVPPSPKSNTRSNSYHSDWFDITVEGDSV